MRQELKQNLLQRFTKTSRIWLSVYPSVIVVLTLSGEMLIDWPFSLRVLVSTLIIVTIVSNVTEPLFAGVFHRVGACWRAGRPYPVTPEGVGACPQQRPLPDHTKEIENVGTGIQRD